MRISVSAISLPEDPGRVLHLEIVEARVVQILLGERIPAIAVAPRDDGHFDLYDGRHRFLAHVIAGKADIEALIVPATATVPALGEVAA